MADHDGRRLVLESDGTLHIESMAIPEPNADQILVRVRTTQVSAGSEVNAIRARRAAGAGNLGRFPSHGLGYTAIGHVAAVGANIKDYAVGDRVLCSGNHASHWLVTPARQTAPASVPQEWNIEKLPPELDDVEAAFCVLGDVALHGVRLAQIQMGESVAVHGLGVIGLIAVQLSRLSGAYPVIGLDLAPERLRLAEELGATHTVLVDEVDPVEAVRNVTALPWRWRGALPGLEPGAGAEVQLHCTSYIGNYPTLIKAAADRGRIILVGATSGEVAIESQELFRRELTVRGSYQTGMIDPHPYWPWTRARNRHTILSLIRRRELTVRPLVSHVVPYHEAPALYEQMLESPEGWLSVFFRWDDLTG